MDSILEKIVAAKQDEVATRSRFRPLAELRVLERRPLGFARAIRQAEKPAIIAEIKRASPVYGVIREDLNVVDVALDFQENGATAVSVLTDTGFFSGSLDDLSSVRDEARRLPLLRRDFIIDPYQIWEARAAGADAVLLTVSALVPRDLERLFRTVMEAEFDALIEVHTRNETERALEMLEDCTDLGGLNENTLLVINNQDLSTRAADLRTTEEIMEEFKRLPYAVISESGIESAEDIIRLLECGVHGFVIGESLLRSGSPGENLRNLLDEVRF